MFKDRLSGALGSAKEKASSAVGGSGLSGVLGGAKEKMGATLESSGLKGAMASLKDRAPEMAKDAFVAHATRGDVGAVLQSHIEEWKEEVMEEQSRRMEEAFDEALATSVEVYEEEMAKAAAQ